VSNRFVITLFGIRSAAYQLSGRYRSGATHHADADEADNPPGRSVILGEKEGDGLPVQAREVLKLDHINPALP
jgi:hypothetical protein